MTALPLSGRLSSSATPYGASTTYAYDYANHTVTATTGPRVQQTTYDGFGRTAKVQISDGGTIKSTVDTMYTPCACSPLGKVWKVSQPYGPNDTVTLLSG